VPSAAALSDELARPSALFEPVTAAMGNRIADATRPRAHLVMKTSGLAEKVESKPTTPAMGEDGRHKPQ
jgi:hypothetical protein